MRACFLYSVPVIEPACVSVRMPEYVRAYDECTCVCTCVFPCTSGCVCIHPRLHTRARALEPEEQAGRSGGRACEGHPAGAARAVTGGDLGRTGS